MMIPKYLQHPDMTESRKKFIEAQVESKRKIMRKAPVFGDIKDAIKAAVQMNRKEKLCNASVWKEPDDIGKKYVAVHSIDRENAGISGYTEVVDLKQIYDISTGNRRNNSEHVEEIEEV